jgi:hypothetical protein
VQLAYLQPISQIQGVEGALEPFGVQCCRKVFESGTRAFHPAPTSKMIDSLFAATVEQCGAGVKLVRSGCRFGESELRAQASNHKRTATRKIKKASQLNEAYDALFGSDSESQ